MENLNAEQVKRGLERCANEWHCGLCGFTEKECALIKKSALALIKSQEKENERLRAENEALAVSEVKECEISQMLVYRIRNKHPAVMAVIADTVRKMHERLEAVKYQSSDWSHGEHPWVVEVEDIDQIAKEMLEGEKHEI